MAALVLYRDNFINKVMKISIQMKYIFDNRSRLLIAAMLFALVGNLSAQNPDDPNYGDPIIMASFGNGTFNSCDAPPNICFDIQLQPADTNSCMEFGSMNGRMFYDSLILRDPQLIPVLAPFGYLYSVVSDTVITPGLAAALNLPGGKWYAFNVDANILFSNFTQNLDVGVKTTVAQLCFTIVGDLETIQESCAPLVWDMEEDGFNGLQGGNEGILVTTLDVTQPCALGLPGLGESGQPIGAIDETAEAYNWQFTGNTSGAVIQQECIMVPCAPLDVELSTFNVMRSGERQAKLFWTTESETNNDYFIVQRSKDGLEFEDIGKVKGHGTTSIRHNYEFYDNNPFIAKNYYRLQQVDYDGSSSLSEIRTVVFEESSRNRELTVVATPNPFINQLSVSYETQLASQLTILDAKGNLVRQMDFTGDVNQQIGFEGLAPGIYFARVVLENDEEMITKVVKAN